jgi:glycerophosphoryl diester phosphodiesterase
MDVHLTRDGHPLVSHDPSTERMGGGRARWCELDLDEARRVDVGRGFVAPDGSRPHAGRGFHAPSFEEVLVELPGVRLNVDIKQATPPMVSPLLHLIRRLRAEDRVTLASFRTRTLLSVRQRGYGGETALAQGEVGALCALPLRAIRALPFVGDAAQVPLRVGPLVLASDWFLRKAHAAGMRVDYWTVNDPDQARRLIALGADGIMTDDPARLAPALRDVSRAT